MQQPPTASKLKGLKGSTRWSQWTPSFLRNPKQWAELKKCVHCKKHGGPHKSHNMHGHHFNKDGIPTNKNGGTGKLYMKE